MEKLKTNRGRYVRTKKHKLLMHRIKKDFKHTEEAKKKIRNKINWMYRYDEEFIKKCKETNYKKGLPGKLNPMYGKKRPDLSQKNKENPMIGKKNPAWLDGRSFEPYGYKFNKKLKKRIRKRDNHTCQLCKEKILKPSKNKLLTVHHIDYNKKNNQDNNLITLCNFCNSSVNTSREQWMCYFQKLQEVSR